MSCPLPLLSPLRPARLKQGCPASTGAVACQTGIFDTGTHNAAAALDVVCACGVLQRRHNSDAFLERFGKRQSPVLVRHWLGTALRNSLSDDSLCGHLRVP